MAPQGHADLSKLVPWKAVDFVGAVQDFWQEYDYRPKAQGGMQEDIDASLQALRDLGVRQIEIQTLFAWSIESQTNAQTGIRSIVYNDPSYNVADPTTWNGIARTRRGDMGLVPYFPADATGHSAPPPFWDQPTPLATPLALTAKATQVLGDMLDAVAHAGLIPVLKCEDYLVVAQDDTDFSGDFNYTDPSRDFDQFYAQYKAYLVTMTQLAAAHQAALLILGTETPYVTGAGIATYANGSSMISQRAMIAAKWQDIIQTVRATAQAAGRPDLALSYTEINPWWDPSLVTPDTVPVWQHEPFWDQLDAVGINFYLPGRETDAAGNVVDTGPPTTAAMLTYGETHNYASDFVGNFADLSGYFVGQKGYSLTTKPVIFPEDGCTASHLGAANPADPAFEMPGDTPDFTEQSSLYEAHFQLGEKYGAGWFAGFGFWQATPSGQWGGPWNPQDPANYASDAAYFDFVGNPTQDIVKTYFARY